MAAVRRVLLLLKPLDVYPVSHSTNLARTTSPQLQVLQYWEDRHKVHKDAIEFCQQILRQKPVDWEPIFRFNLLKPISGFDLVVTVGGDGTLLRASHFIDQSIPVLGVNSDPTRVKEAEQLNSDFDASRSTGYLCAATVKNFEQVRRYYREMFTAKKEWILDVLIHFIVELFNEKYSSQVLNDVLAGRKIPSNLSRMSVSINSQLLSTSALNDMLIAHPCPATVSRLSFKIHSDGESCTPLANCRSSGLRVSTAAGSTAAMHSAGGFVMPILSQELQYMVREPILPAAAISKLMHGIIKPDQSMEVRWFSEKGVIYIDGSHVSHPIQYGDILQISSKAPILKVFLPNHVLL